ncbi:hypothetical protein ACVOMV_04260 [Mesorhizobium atlanticum]
MPAESATFSMKRGPNLDQWVTCADRGQMGRSPGDPALSEVAPIPQAGRPREALKDAGLDFLRMSGRSVALWTGPRAFDDLYARGAASSSCRAAYRGLCARHDRPRRGAWVLLVSVER